MPSKCVMTGWYDQLLSAECNYSSSCLDRLLSHVYILGMQALTVNTFLHVGLCEGFTCYLTGHNDIVFLIYRMDTSTEVALWWPIGYPISVKYEPNGETFIVAIAWVVPRCPSFTKSYTG